MKTKLTNFQWFLLVLSVLWALIYFFYLRNLVILAYENNAPEWFNGIIKALYPRFFVEKHRFSHEFFLKKTDLVVLRSVAVLIFVLVWGQKIYDLIFDQKVTSHINLEIFKWVIYLVAPLYYWDWLIEFNKLSQVKEFYQPTLFGKLLMPNFPPTFLLCGLFGLMVISNMLVFINKWLFSSGMVFATCFVLLQNVFLSFHKIDHGFATYIYCLMIFPWVGMVKRDQNQGNSDFWPIRLIWVAITVSYFMSGLEKLTISGLNWFLPNTMKGYLLMHNTSLGIFVSQFDWLCILLSMGGLLFQLCFISVLFRPKLIWVFVPAGIFFHFMTGLLFQISGFLSPWQLVYVFFIDWEKVWAVISNKGFLYKMINTKNG